MTSFALLALEVVVLVAVVARLTLVTSQRLERPLALSCQLVALVAQRFQLLLAAAQLTLSSAAADGYRCLLTHHTHRAVVRLFCTYMYMESNNITLHGVDGDPCFYR